MKTEGYYVNTGRWQSVKEKKIKIVVFGMVVALLVTFLPFRQTEIYAGISENAYSYYQEYGNNVCFFPFSETDGMIYYATKANLASSDTATGQPMEVVGKGFFREKTADDVF